MVRTVLEKSVTNPQWSSEVSCANYIGFILETVKSSQQLVQSGWDFDGALIFGGMSSWRELGTKYVFPAAFTT